MESWNLEVRSVSPTFILDFAIGVVAGGVALVGAEVGLRRPDVEPLPQHGPGPQLRVRTTQVKYTPPPVTTKQTEAATKQKHARRQAGRHRCPHLLLLPPLAPHPLRAAGVGRRDGLHFLALGAAAGEGMQWPGRRAPPRGRGRGGCHRLRYSGQLAVAGSFAWPS